MEELSKPNSNVLNRFFNTTTIIAVISAYLYFVAYLFEKGNCDFYRIPETFIVVNLITLLSLGATLSGVLFGSLKSFGLLAPILRGLSDEKQRHWKPVYLINLILLPIGLFISITFPRTWEIFLIVWGSILAFNLIFWGIGFLFQIRKKKTIEEKVQSSILKYNDKFDLVQYVATKLTLNQYLIMLAVIAIPLLMYLLGYGSAMSKEEYMSFHNKSNIVVIKKYDELLICRSIKKNSNEMDDSLFLYKSSDLSDIAFKYSKIGRLKRK